MAAALGTLRFTGISGTTRAISIYLNDTTASAVRFDEAKIAVAGSPDYFQTKEGGYITDVALTSDIATPSHLQILRNGTPTGDILDATAQLISVVSRPSPRIPFQAGDKIQITQIA